MLMIKKIKLFIKNYVFLARTYYRIKNFIYFSLDIFPGKNIITKKYISTFLPKNAIIVEAGAHTGTDTLEMAMLWPTATIYAFEPVPEIFEKLKKNTKKCNNVVCVPLALSNKNGFAEIFISSGFSDASSSLLKPKEHLNIYPNVQFKNSIQVQTITLSDWVEKNKIKKIDFLWLDLQGMEYDVLKESKKILLSVSAIFTEILLIESYFNSKKYSLLKKLLFQNNFIVEREEIFHERKEGNALFIKNK